MSIGSGTMTPIGAVGTGARAKIERIIVSRCGGWLTAAGLSDDVDGTNGDLADAIAAALKVLGITPADRTNPTDAEVASVPGASEEKLIDVAECRTLLTIAQNMTQTTISVAGRSESLSDLGSRIDARVKDALASLEKNYGIGLQEIESGFIELDFLRDPDAEDNQA